ncbi:hypothetical protein [Streptomyces sp. NPDC087270]|uniref:hypothetical protein n=1 Tax=Streptomyces sp. NPDC087270 TaxID=3365774 RepID=UPI00381D301A
MRARTAVTATALAAATALTLTACGGGSGGGGDKISTSPSTSAATAAPTTSSPASGSRIVLDPSVKLPAGLKLDFAWSTPSDPAQKAALTATANFMQSMVHGVVEQNPKDGSLYGFATDSALTYAKTYVQNHVSAKRTLTGTDDFYRPVVKLGAKSTVAEVTFCENDAKLYAKDLSTGKVDTTPAGDDSYTSYDIVLAKMPTQAELWQARSVTYKERAVQCKQ